jgi:hypothetical protein
VARGSRIFAVLLACGLGAGAAAAPTLARERITRTALRLCAERSGQRCELGSVHIAGDGALLRDLVVRGPDGSELLRVQRVAARWNWMRLALRRTQGVSLRVSGVRLRDQGGVHELRARWTPRVPTARGDGGRRLRVDSVRIDDIAADLRVRAREDSALHFRGEAATASWERGGAARVQWRDAVFEHPRASAHSGACQAVFDATRASVDCEGFSSDADVATLGALTDELHGLVAAPEVPGSAPADLAAEETTLRRAAVHLRGGAVRLAHRGQQLVNLSPASVDLSFAGRRLEEARLDVGAAGEPETSISLLMHRPIDAPWRLALSAGDLPLRRLAPWIPGVPWHGTDRGTARAQLRLSPGARDGVFAVEGDLAVRDFGIQHPGLAREPVDGLALTLEGRAEVDLVRRRVTSPGVNASVNGIRFSVGGWVERDTVHTAFDASFRLPQLDCDTPRTALPANVVGPLANFAFAGTLAADAQIRLDSRRLAETAFDFHVEDHCLVSRAAWELDVRRFARPFVQRAQEPGGVVRAFITGPGSPAWVPFTAISPFVPAAVVSREDGNFYRHHGFSPDEVRGALVRNVTLGRFAYGASTISMQLVKNVFLAREKTLVRKLQEVALTWWLERSLDKTSILELYLNVVEFGPGIYGIGPASRFFFGVEPRDLTILQGIYLATLLPAPVPRFAFYERGSVPMETLNRLRSIARAMGASRLIEQPDAEQARAEGLAFRPSSVPPPGAATWTVDAATTDEAAQAMVERAGVRVNESAPTPAQAAEAEADDDGPQAP